VQKSLKLVSGQTSVKRYLEPLTKLIQEKKVDTTSIISHRSTRLEEGPDLYQAFKEQERWLHESRLSSRRLTGSAPGATYKRSRRERCAFHQMMLRSGQTKAKDQPRRRMETGPYEADQQALAHDCRL
jgi:hypothetical protein